MPIRLLAIDLDGTLLNSRAEISPGNRQALCAAVERGVHVAIVTGRRFHSASPMVNQLPCPVTLICSNGALIRSENGEIVHRDFLPRDVALEALRASRPYRPHAVAIFDIPTRGQVTMQKGASPDGPLSWYVNKSPEFLATVPELEDAIEIDPIQLMFGGPPAYMAPLEGILRESSAGEKVHLTWTKYFSRNMSLLDVLSPTCSKGAALRLWAERRRISPGEIMAIGDNYNDREMLEFCGHPVLMRNCTPGLGQSHWCVTDSNDQDGVAAAVHSYILGS